MTAVTRSRDPLELAALVVDGHRAALPRLLSVIERGGEAARAAGRILAPRAGDVYTVGVTGPPGAGKSTLTDALITLLRRTGDEVAVLAVDPTSPFSGGALLGDRVRMMDHALDAGVFIRSMATRGHLGGLALAAPEAIRALDAAGFPLVIVETVGVGQVEVEIAGAADTTLVVLNPGSGDSVQANKAGLLEVADVFVINKADRPGAASLERDLEFMLHLSDDPAWTPPIVRSVASRGEGGQAVLDAIARHRLHLEATGELAIRRGRRRVAELREILNKMLEQQAADMLGAGRHAGIVADVEHGRIDPYEGAQRLLGR